MKTAVQYLIKSLEEYYSGKTSDDILWEEVDEIYGKALAMEKKQITDAYDAANDDGGITYGELYYNENFNNE